VREGERGGEREGGRQGKREGGNDEGKTTTTSTWQNPGRNTRRNERERREEGRKECRTCGPCSPLGFPVASPSSRRSRLPCPLFGFAHVLVEGGRFSLWAGMLFSRF
jgi:hypothetical protein